MSGYKIALDVVLIILPFVGIIVLLAGLLLVRRLLITVKKVDYLIEDVTFKISNLNTTFDTIKKLNNYFNLAEVLVKRNLQTSVKYLVKNRDLAYKALDYVKSIVNTSANDSNIPEKDFDEKLDDVKN